MSLLEKLKGGKRNTRKIPFPGTDQDVALQVLSNAEKQDALFATEDLFKKKGIRISTTTVEAYEDENATQILARALRDPQDPETPFSGNADELRTLLTTGEKDLLVEAYDSFEKEVSPSAKDLTEAELEELVDTLKKTPGFGSSLSSPTLRQLTMYSVNRLSN